MVAPIRPGVRNTERCEAEVVGTLSVGRAAGWTAY